MGLLTKLFQKRGVRLPNVFGTLKYNLKLSYPENWQVLSTSGYDPPWVYVVQIAGPRSEGGARPGVSVLTQVGGPGGVGP
jgi:hypothetical protein